MSPEFVSKCSLARRTRDNYASSDGDGASCPQEMRAAGRRLPARTQVGMLRAVRDALAAREPSRDGLAGDPAGAAAAAGPPADPSDAAAAPAAARPAPPAAGAPANGAHAAGEGPPAPGGAAGMQASLHGQRQCAEGGAFGGAEGEGHGAGAAGECGAGGGGNALDAWILQNLRDEAARKARVDALVAMARPFAYARTQVLQALGDIYDHNVA
jgi:hypothetical protein